MVRLGRFLRAATISEAWQRGLNLIWRQGQELIDERGTRIKEVLSLQIVVEDPYRDMIPREYSWNEDRLKEYALQLQSGVNQLLGIGGEIQGLAQTPLPLLDMENPQLDDSGS